MTVTDGTVTANGTGTGAAHGTVVGDGAVLRDGAVLGDGTTARGRARTRWRRWRLTVGIVLGLVVAGVVVALPQPRSSGVPLAPDNVEPGGARAAAQVLGRQGVDVTYVRTTAEAVAAAGAGTTLLVTGDFLLTDEQVERLAGTAADVVLLDPGWALGAFTDAITASYGTSFTPTVRSPACDDPDAEAAGPVAATGAFAAAGPGATVCYPDPSATTSGGGGAYATVTQDGRRVSVLADGGLLTNARLAQQGNAALVLRVLGRHPDLVWFVPSFDDVGTDPDGDVGGPAASLVPPVVGVLGLQAVLVALVAAAWRVRRTGRLVTEPLPVVVRAAETVRGRGRLYRRARAHGRAGAALRAGCASRCAARLGLPRSAPAPAVIEAVRRATGRDAAAVAALLYGPPPRTDVDLTRLATELDHLESEVHHP